MPCDWLRQDFVELSLQHVPGNGRGTQRLDDGDPHWSWQYLVDAQLLQGQGQLRYFSTPASLAVFRVRFRAEPPQSTAAPLLELALSKRCVGALLLLAPVRGDV